MSRALVVLGLVGAAASLIAVPLARGSDLTTVLAKLATYFGLICLVSLVLQRFPRLRDAAGKALSSGSSVLDGWLTERRARYVLAGGIVLYAVVWSVLSILRHLALNSSGFDLAIQHQVVWNLAHGRGYESSIEVSNYLGDHVALTLPLFAPLLWIWDDVRILLIAQSIVIGLSAWPLYRLARRRCGRPVDGLLWAFVALMTPAVGFMNKYDFHDLVLALPFLLAAIDAVDEGRIGRSSIWLLLASATREEVGLAVMGVGLWALLARRRRLWGGAVALLALIWSLVALYVVIPHFRQGVSSDTLDRYVWLGGGPIGILHTLFSDPQRFLATHYHRVRRLVFPVQLLWPMGGLPLFALTRAALAAPNLALSLGSSAISQNSIYFQYNAPILPFLFWAGLEGFRRLERGGASRAMLIVWVLFGLAAANWADPAAFKSVPRPYTIVDGVRPRPNRDAFREAARIVPSDAGLVAGEHLAPQFSARRHLRVFTLRKGVTEEPWVILDLTDVRHIESPTELARGAARWVVEKGYRVVFFRDGILLLCRACPGEPKAYEALRAYLSGSGISLAG